MNWIQAKIILSLPGLSDVIRNVCMIGNDVELSNKISKILSLHETVIVM